MDTIVNAVGLVSLVGLVYLLLKYKWAERRWRQTESYKRLKERGYET